MQRGAIVEPSRADVVARGVEQSVVDGQQPLDRDVGGAIVSGAASATLAIFLAQAVVLAGYGVLVLGLPAPESPLVIVLAWRWVPP